MSEEKVSLTPFESYMENRMNNMWDKISELESNHNTLSSLVKLQEQSIEELEKKIDKLQSYYKIIADCDPCKNTERIEKIEKDLTTFQTKYPYTTAHNNSRELAELEKKLDKLQSYYKIIADCDPCKNTERIEKLEQEVKEWKSKYDDIEEAHKIWWDDLVSTHKEEINELKQIVDSQATLNDFYHKSINELKDQIAKLEGGEKS